jgi:pimeloyl-ACP methyl ester carboxylesterase
MTRFIPLLGCLLWAQLLLAQTSIMDIPYPVDTRFVTLPSGIRIAYTDQGKLAEGPTLVFIHGLGSNLKCWQKTIDSISAHARCIALDLPGYGKTDKGEYAYDMTFFANTLREFVHTLTLKNVVLVGHSMGGQIATTAILQDSLFAQKLVLLAPAGFETFTEQEKAWFQMVYTPALLKSTTPEQIRKNFELNFTKFPADAEFMVQDRLAMRETSAYERYCTMIPQCVMGMLREPVFERLSKVKTPTLVLYGENDALIPNRILHKTLTTKGVAESGQAKLPNSQLHRIPGAGHFVQWEGAAEVNQAILNFLK